MGNFWDKQPPAVEPVPPLYDSLPLTARSSMMESPYNILFGKVALKRLFNDYFEESRHFRTMLMSNIVSPPDEDGTSARLDLIASTVSKNGSSMDLIRALQLRYQCDVIRPEYGNLLELSLSTSDEESNAVIQLKSLTYFREYGFRHILILPSALRREDYPVINAFRYDSANFSVGTTLCQRSAKNVWLLSKIGSLTVGAQYEHPCSNGSEYDRRFDNLKNWSYAIGYGVGSNPLLSPSFNVCLELAKNSQLIASFCQHLVVQTRVQNPLEENEMRITNYIDLGFELQTRVDGVKSTNNFRDSTFQVAASWQADKYFLLKGKLGTCSGNLALVLKAWSATFHISATKSTEEKTRFGFGIRFENLLKTKPDERADPMVIPNSDPLADPNMLYNVTSNPLADQNMLYNVGRY